jgi:membrane protein
MLPTTNNRQPRTFIFNRHRIGVFARFTVRRFLDEHCLQTAGALAFTSLFALVPLITVVLSILAAFPVFAQWRDKISGFIFANFLPASGDVVQTYFTQFADNASKATAIGILVLVFSAVSLMLSIEDAFNRIWRVTVARKAAARFAMYWTVLTLGPLLLVAMLATSSYVFALPLLEQADAFKAYLLGWLPLLIQWFVLTVAYTLIPNCKVRMRHAVIGAVMTALTFEAAKQGFGAYVARASYQEIYGALSIVPVFIFWIYLSWIFVLLGASLTASIQAFDYNAHQPESNPDEIKSPEPRSDPEMVAATEIPEEKP